MAKSGEHQRSDGTDGDRARCRIEQREFAELRTGTQFSDLAAPAQDGSTPFEDYEERLTFVPLAYDLCPFGDFDYFDMASHDAQVAGRASSEQWYAAETLNGRGA